MNKFRTTALTFVAGILTVGMFSDTANAQQKCTVQTIGKTFGCSVNGQPGEKTCLEPGVFSPCVPSTQPVSGSFIGKYWVLTIIYAPPGTNGGNSTSQVSYGSGSTTGVTTSLSNSFKQDTSVSWSITGDFLCEMDPVSKETFCPLKIGGGPSFEDSVNHTRVDAVDIRKTTSTSINDNGPAADGIDHNRDQIWLLLRPKIDFTILSTNEMVNLRLDSDQSGAVLQYVYVGDLKDPSKFPPGVLRDLMAAGVTAQDYLDILDYDPLSKCLPEVVEPNVARTTATSVPKPCNTPPPSTPRYVPMFTSVPYEPPFAPGDPVPTQLYAIDNTTTTTTTTSDEESHKSGFTLEASLEAKNLFLAALKDENDLTLTTINTTSGSAMTEQKMSLTMGGPSFGYAGPTNIAVYYDTTYKTFAFVPFEISGASLHGTVLRDNGKPRVGQPVSVMARGITYRTFTNTRGEYRFPAGLSGTLVVRAGNVAQPLRQLDATKSIDFRF